MTLSVQTKTNRINAQKSTGPTSPSGKAAIRSNAIKHGIHSNIPTLLHENPKLFEALTADLYAELSPKTRLERETVDRIIMTLIRQRRLRTAETATIQASIDQVTTPIAQPFRIKERYEILAKEFDAIGYQFNPNDPEAFKNKAPNIYKNTFSGAKNKLSPAAAEESARVGQILFDSLMDDVDKYMHAKTIAENTERNAANLLACQLLPNTPEMLFLTRYQVQLDNELTRLLNLYHGLQTRRQLTEMEEVNVADQMHKKI